MREADVRMEEVAVFGSGSMMTDVVGGLFCHCKQTPHDHRWSRADGAASTWSRQRIGEDRIHQDNEKRRPYATLFDIFVDKRQILEMGCMGFPSTRVAIAQPCVPELVCEFAKETIAQRWIVELVEETVQELRVRVRAVFDNKASIAGLIMHTISSRLVGCFKHRVGCVIVRHVDAWTGHRLDVIKIWTVCSRHPFSYEFGLGFGKMQCVLAKHHEPCQTNMCCSDKDVICTAYSRR